MPNRRLTRYLYSGHVERQCSQCHVWIDQNDTNFSYNRNREQFNSWCKPCARSYARSQRSGGKAGRRFGVEIEFIGDSRRLADAMAAEGLNCRIESYNHRVSRTTWKIVPDGSLTGVGAELVSPILRGEAGFAALAAVGRALMIAKAKVNSSTGMHVHHDVHDLTVSQFKRLVNNWANCQPAIDGLVAVSRRPGGSGSRWCQPFDSYVLAQLNRNLTSMNRSEAGYALRGDRYYALNLQSYGRYGTVEVRQHQGTVDAVKIAAWVRFGQAMVEAAIAGQSLVEGFTTCLLDALPLADETRTYLARRATMLASSADQTKSATSVDTNSLF